MFRLFEQLHQKHKEEILFYMEIYSDTAIESVITTIKYWSKRSKAQPKIISWIIDLESR